MNHRKYQIFIFIALITLVSAASQYWVRNSYQNSTTIILNLYYTGSDQYYLKPKSPIIKQLTFIFHVLAYSDFYFKIFDSNKKRFQVPQYGVFPIDPFAKFSFPLENSAVNFTYSFNPFDFKIMRKQNGAILFSTQNQNLIFSDHYLQIGTQVDTQFVYGIGERFGQTFRKGDGKWTIFNRDRGQFMDRGTGYQTHGFYPFYLLKEKKSFFHINYFRNSNAMDLIKSTINSKNFVTYKVIGGIFDFRFFLGVQNAQKTVQKLNFYSGQSALPPFWSLGFHQCRWGYKNITYLENVVSNYQKNGLPLDTIWSDIDYLNNYQTFTIDQNKFPLDRMKKLLENYHYIPIIEVGIKTSGDIYEEGLKRGVFLKDANGKDIYLGKVWPGQTTFVDFFQPNATKYWQDMLDKLYQKINFSGAWLDMNEISNFCNGPCSSPKEESIFDYSKDLPYNPGNDSIQTMSVSLNATHYGGISQANVHAFTAFLQTHATNLFLKSKNLKPFIITRSSTFGSNKFGFHWTGDNYASWDFLKGSISDNFNSQMYGFQMVGPDICGFGGNATQQICARWFQIGSLYPFSRNHNQNTSIDQEPYAMGPIVLKSAYNNLKLRYSLLKHYYSLFINKGGLGTIWRPLFFEFPLDQNTYIDEIADTQFMIGSSLLSTPIVQQGKTSRKIYLPQTNWYNVHNGEKYTHGTHLIQNIGLSDKVPLFVKQGIAIFTQNTKDVVNTKQLDNRFKLLTGMKYDATTSNATRNVFQSRGSILSIKNYHDDQLVDSCYRLGCNYNFMLAAQLTQSNRTLQIVITYSGAAGLNQEIVVDQIHLTLDSQIILMTLQKPLVVTGPQTIFFTIPKATINPTQTANLKFQII